MSSKASSVQINFPLSELKQYELDELIQKAIDLKNTHMRFQTYDYNNDSGLCIVQCYKEPCYHLQFELSNEFKSEYGSLLNMKKCIQHTLGCHSLGDFVLVNDKREEINQEKIDQGNETIYIHFKYPDKWETYKQHFIKQPLIQYKLSSKTVTTKTKTTTTTN